MPGLLICNDVVLLTGRQKLAIVRTAEDTKGVLTCSDSRYSARIIKWRKGGPATIQQTDTIHSGDSILIIIIVTDCIGIVYPKIIKL